MGYVRVVLYTVIACLLATLCVSANEKEVTLEQAILIAKAELERAVPDPARYDVYVDKENKGWDGQMARLKESPRESDQAEFQKYNSVLKSRKYWSIFVVRRSDTGGYAKDDGFTALVDKETGKVLFFIPGG